MPGSAKTRDQEQNLVICRTEFSGKQMTIVINRVQLVGPRPMTGKGVTAK